MAKAAKVETPSDDGYGINDLAKELDREPHLVRVALRKNEVEKEGGRYRWGTRKEFDAVVKMLERETPAPAKTAPAKKAAAPAAPVRKGAAPIRKGAAARKAA